MTLPPGRSEARFGGYSRTKPVSRRYFLSPPPVIFFSLLDARLLEYRKFDVVGDMRLLMSVCHCESPGDVAISDLRRIEIALSSRRDSSQ
jgi:hypothetical protein